MLRELIAFLSLFSVLSLVMGIAGMAFIFGLGALVLLAADLLLSHFLRIGSSLPSSPYRPSF